MAEIIGREIQHGPARSRGFPRHWMTYWSAGALMIIISDKPRPHKKLNEKGEVFASIESASIAQDAMAS